VNSREPLLTSTHPGEYADIHFSACLFTATRHCGSKPERDWPLEAIRRLMVRVYAASGI
jgi:hypothetical protein